jgi:hypothetical protein
MLDEYDIFDILTVKSYEFNPNRTYSISNVTYSSVYHYL